MDQHAQAKAAKLILIGRKNFNRAIAEYSNGHELTEKQKDRLFLKALDASLSSQSLKDTIKSYAEDGILAEQTTIKPDCCTHISNHH